MTGAAVAADPMRFHFQPRRWSVVPPRMTVRRHVPLGWRFAGAIVVVVVSIVVGVVLARSGWVRGGAPPVDPAVAHATAEVRALRAERDRLRTAADAIAAATITDASRVIESATVRELGQQVERLEADNARLKEDVAFFEAATADRPPAGAVDAASGIAIRRFQVMREAGSATARYRLLLTQDSRATRDFVGTLELSVTVVENGARQVIVLPRDVPPGAATPTTAFDVVFRSYKRLDGTCPIPPGATLESVQARIRERGVVRVQQTFTPP